MEQPTGLIGHPFTQGARGHLLALLAGAVAPLGFAPFNLWPLALVSAVVLLACWAQADTRTTIFRGWLYGLGFFGVGVSWVYVSINQFGQAPVWLAAGLTLLFAAGIALFFAIHGLLFRLVVATGNNSLTLWLGFAAVWTLAEWLRSWLLTGFPWLYLGYAPMDTWLGHWAPIGGVYSLSFFTALGAGAIYLLLRRPYSRLSLAATLLSALPWLTGPLLAQQEWVKTSPQPPVKVALIQGNTPQNLKWDPAYRQATLDLYQNLSLQQLDRDLIIWPETAIPLLLEHARPALKPLEALLEQAGIGLISGAPTRTQEGTTPRYFNSVAGLAAAQGTYHKQRLVPFGEYVPLEQWLRGLIAFFDLPMSSFSLGPDRQPPLTLKREITLAPYICYEIVYPDLVAEGRPVADILLTLSNDSWFGDSLAPHQHLQMARLRARENGRYLLRATNNGISAIIAPDGRVLKQTPQFQRSVLRGEVEAMQGSTPFSRWGSLPLLVICGVLALLAAQHARRDRSAERPPAHTESGKA